MGEVLENFSLDHRYEPMKTALNELGFIVDFIEKRAQKTVITVSHCEKGGKNPVSAKEEGCKRHFREKGEYTMN